MSRVIYLDYAAGTPLKFQFYKKSLQALKDCHYNPEALYRGATIARQHLEDNRQVIAKLLSVKTGQLFFIPGATLANNLVRLAVGTQLEGRCAALTIDHDSLKQKADCLLPVCQQGGQLRESDILNIPDDVCLLSLAGVNSELGLRHDLSSLRDWLSIVNARRLERQLKLPLLLHIDASQMILTENVQPQALARADFVTFNGGKAYACQQSGLLYIRRPAQFQPLILAGGNQENGWYPGTPSIFASSVFAEALTWIDRQRRTQVKRLQILQNRFEKQLRQLSARIVLEGSSRSCGLTTACFAGFDNEYLALQLSQQGVYVGLGSACHSQTGSAQRSVLRHLGYATGEIYGTLRFSFGYETRRVDLDKTVRILANLLKDQTNRLGDGG